MSRPKGHVVSPETREKMRVASSRLWADPEYRARRAMDVGGRPKGFHHSIEIREKLRAAMLRKWADPAYRARHAEGMMRGPTRRSRPAFLPPRGTPERKLYEKIRLIAGLEAARATL